MRTLLALSLCTLAACQSRGQVRDIDIDTIDEITQISTSNVLAQIRTQDSAEHLWLAYAGVDNKSAVDLGTAKAEIDTIVTEEIVSSQVFRNISEHQVKAARRAAEITHVEDLTLDGPREKFLAVLTEEGRVPEYIMFALVTTADEDGGSTRRFRLSLQVMNASTGEVKAQKSGTFTRSS